MKTRIGRGGRLVIPAPYRRQLGLRPGDEVVVRVEAGELRVLTVSQALARARALLGSYVSPGRSLARELVSERREEAARE
ncbi:MAG: AbrB/MazE/SpoVT family DNA-binding domain-containing protein [Armatimonadota bacterium]|nr:AbrB/MazE/SpoVT family DNA-binding domain-containing protein [Armatimonadota bacterium]MDR5676476.1 AbrB/MazE/SpoVT family DNA-binding domain-containing protein [Armatimonadota bacterium]MDR7386406.1 AbrB/MazE/SpoVT family DNA-binding domain-containing protein [Armatimonadota bacterium]MDR7388046.1 AbrB/MazE/SpoVT family DNA-binding domain-containing protein [Armatimonadota bacterium]MDR7391484.1 AbrB/MazE/SpoVT family DNA-binding domain-containing protein [Armatimonadota bacterium]